MRVVDKSGIKYVDNVKFQHISPISVYETGVMRCGRIGSRVTVSPYKLN